MRGWMIVLAVAAGLHLGDPTPARSADAPRRPGNCWAVLVGVDNYIELGKLQFAGNDQRALARQLVASGFPEDQVFLLDDKATEPKLLPFRENIEKQLGLVTGLAEPGDLVILGFSGHGVEVDGKSYLCPLDTRLDKLTSTMVSLESVYQRLAQCKASLKLLLVDACRNNAVPAGRRSVGLGRSLGEFQGIKEKPPEGILLLAGCASGQVSMEDPEFGHGVFMHFVLEGLRGKAAGATGAISLAGLYDYASLQTKKYVARKFNEQQTPALRGTIEGPFEICTATPRGVTKPDPPANGFVSLFDGKTLNGWQGDRYHYRAVDGHLISDFGPTPYPGNGGQLLSQAQYGDFILKFDFRLSPGANSGVFLRAAANAQSAQDALEFQILDAFDGEYSGLPPEKSAGSLAKVMAPQHRCVMPTEVWNSAEIRWQGNRLVIVLNGVAIIDTNTHEAGDKLPSAQRHPGLRRERGHIGLNGCYSRGRVEYRNIEIQELARP